MILIIDNGSQYTHLIKRNCRDLGHDSETINGRENWEKAEAAISAGGAERIILSGGPSSVYTDPENLSKTIARKALAGELKLPLLGICYGHQAIAYAAGAKVAKGLSAEYGITDIEIDDEDLMFAGVPKKLKAWVSHFDEVKALPKGFSGLAHSGQCAIEAMRHRTKSIFGVQFHPEVWHTEHGERMLKNFLEVSR